MSVSEKRELCLNSFSMIVDVQNEVERARVLNQLPHNLTMFPVCISAMVSETNDNGQTIYRSKERIRLIELEDNKLHIKCEEYNIFIAVCSFLNEWKISHDLDRKEKVAVEYTFEHTLTDVIANISTQEPIQFINESIDAIKIKFLFDSACINSGFIEADAIINYIESIKVVKHHTNDKDELILNKIVKSDIKKIELTSLGLNAIQDTLQRIKNSYKDINDDNLDEYLDG